MTRLIYRGETIAYTPKTIQSYRKLYAINWRYQVAGGTYEKPLPVNVSHISSY